MTCGAWTVPWRLLKLSTAIAVSSVLLVSGESVADEPYSWRRLPPTSPASQGALELPATNYTDQDFPLFRQQDRKFFCEACQSFVHVLHSELNEQMNKFESAKNSKSSFGRYEVLLETQLTAGAVCRLHDRWTYVAEKSEVYVERDLSEFCSRLILHDEEIVEAFVSRKDMPWTSHQLCVKMLDFCSQSDIWQGEDVLERREGKSERNQDISDKYFATVTKRAGVLSTGSGLAYEILKEPTGDEMITDDVTKIMVVYNATFVNGVSFDNSDKWGGTVEFPLKDLIAGIKEGLKLSGVGGDIILSIPPWLGYKAAGAGRLIGPNMALIYRMQVTEIVEREAPAAADKESPAEEVAEEVVEEVVEEVAHKESPAEEVAEEDVAKEGQNDLDGLDDEIDENEERAPDDSWPLDEEEADSEFGSEDFEEDQEELEGPAIFERDEL